VKNPVTHPPTKTNRTPHASPTSTTGPRETAETSVNERGQTALCSRPDPMTFPYAPVTGAGLQQIQFWSAPFPPPQAVREYEQVAPGTWNRILEMAEESQASQISTMRSAQEFCRRDTKRGHVLGVIVTLSAMACALCCAYIKQPWVAAAFLSVTVMTVARSLVETAHSVSHLQGLAKPAASASENAKAASPSNVDA